MIKNYVYAFTACCLFFSMGTVMGQKKKTVGQLQSVKSSPIQGQTFLLKGSSKNELNDKNEIPKHIEESLKAIRESYDQEKLASLAKKFYDKEKLEKAYAIAYAQKNNLPIREESENGTIIELQRVLPDGTPLYYSTYNVDAAVSTRANYLNTGGGLGLNLNGNGMTAYVWDGGPTRPTHREFDGAGGTNRVTINDGATTGFSNHAQHVTGIIVSSGEFAANSKGMAWQANALTHDWTNDESEATTAAANGMLLSNHSYGIPLVGNTGLNFNVNTAFYIGGYTQFSRDWDIIMNNAPYYLRVAAAGNEGDINGANPTPLEGNINFDKLTTDKCAKNGLVVANADDAVINPDGSLNSVLINSSSSEGPTDDYRIKPDITGNGTLLYSTLADSDQAYAFNTGTSMASPNVCGSLLLLQEHYNNINGVFMRGATLKGLALHTTDDMGINGPDPTHGWGLMNAKFAAETITNSNAGSTSIVRELNLTNGGTYEITVQSDGINPLLASISWNDPAGVAQTTGPANDNTPALVNDLDIRVSNGTTYMPWRLTGVTTNSQGDNLVDPYERVDVNGASGQYTITVTHKGTLSGGSQNFALIVTGASEVAATPQIGFNSTSGNSIEGTDCAFNDIVIPVNIAQAPSANADVTFSISGGTAISGVDFDLMTSNLTFNAGSTASQNLIVRVYADGFVESDETFTIDMSVNANGGDATESPVLNSITYTIQNDDVTPIATVVTELASFDMSNLGSWSVHDADGDGYNWFGVNGITGGIFSGQALASETNLAAVNNQDGATGTTDPDNYIVSSAINVPNGISNLELRFGIASVGTNEHWGIYWVDQLTVQGIQNATLLEEGDTTAGVAQVITHNVANLAAVQGQTGYIAFRHFNSDSGNGFLAVDTFTVNATTTTPIQTAVNNGTTNDNILLPGNGTIYTADGSNDNLILDITNNNTHDYGCVTTSVARSGTGATAYNGSVAPNLVMDKTFYINAANTAASGDVSITFYFTEAEIAGWETATGLNRNQLTVLRDDAGAITFAPDGNQTMAAETSNLTIGTFGPGGVTLTGTFTGLTGGYVFGPSAAFPETACFVPRIYLQGPYDAVSGMMTDGLRSGGHIPLTSPYGDGVTTTNAVLSVTGNNAIVDWVWVELRDKNDNTSVLASTSALVQRDGDVVGAVDGTSTLKFSVPADDYYVSINHRNHLAFMSAAAITNIDASCKVIDFTDTSVTNFGTNAQAVSGGVRLMWAGDVNNDGMVVFSGNSNDSNDIKNVVLNDGSNILGLLTYNSLGYSNGDLTMNGGALFSGNGNDTNDIKSNVLSYPSNILGLLTFSITEQLP